MDLHRKIPQETIALRNILQDLAFQGGRLFNGQLICPASSELAYSY